MKLKLLFLFVQMLLLSQSAVSAGVQLQSEEQGLQLIATVSQQIKQDDKDAHLYVVRGQLYAQLKDYDNAIKDFNKALALDDKQDDAWYGLGMAKPFVGLLDEGISDLSVFINKHPDSSLALTKRGVRYIWKGDKVNAKKDLLKAVKLNPNNAEAHDDLGVVLAQQGDYNSAIEHFNNTITIDPSYQKGHHNLAMALYVIERDALALERVNISLQLDPQARNSWMLKSEILKAMGRVTESEAAHDEAMFLPKGNWSERAPVK